MKKLIVTYGLISVFTLMTVPAFPSTIKFDFYGGDTSYPQYPQEVFYEEVNLSANQTGMVGVWLTDYALGDDVKLVAFGFEWDEQKIEVMDAYPYDTDHGGPWDPLYSYSHDYYQGVYNYLAMNPFCIVVDSEVKLQTIELKSISGGNSQIETLGGVGWNCLDMDFYPDSDNATIHGPCKVNIDPVFKVVSGGETVQFTASPEPEEICASPDFEFVVTDGCGSSIDPASGLYTAWDADFPCTDTVTVTDNANIDYFEDCGTPPCPNISAEATVGILPILTIVPQGPNIGAGGSIVFKGVNSGFCDNDPIYSWSVVSDIGSTIGEGNSTNASGFYRAGKDFSACDEATDVIKLKAECPDDNDPPEIIKEREVNTSVTIPPCVVTISPNPAEILTGETILFTATSNECCKIEPCYTWAVSDGEGNTTNSDGPTYAWSESAVGTTVTLTDPCNDPPPSDKVNVSVITTTTTSTPPKPPTTTTSIIPEGVSCITDKSCNDLVFCNGEETCVYSWSTGLAGSTGNTTGSKLGVCTAGEVPCPDDGEYCTGEESCDEENETCLNSGDPCEPEGLVCDEESDICRPQAECVDDEDCDDDGLFCNGDEICVDGSCDHSGDPCLEGTECVEETDECRQIPPPLSFTLFPDSALRSHLIPLPLFMLILSDDPGTKFDNTATVSFGGDAVTTPLTLVLSEDLIFTFSLINPTGLGATGNTEVEVTVTTDEGEGIETLTLILLPFILDGSENVLE